MNIAICDDNRASGEFILSKVKKIEPDCNVFVFVKGCEFINCKCEWDVVFLDIEMDEVDGFALAKILKQQQKRCIFSFVTTHSELAVDGYDYQPFRYILKDAPDEVIDRKVRETINEYHFRNSRLKISYKGIQKNINVAEISSIEITGHCLKISLGGELILWNKSLQDIEKILEKYDFVRCHRSFMVSLKHIRKFTSKLIEVDNGKKVPVGRSYQKKAETEYVKFLINNQ